MVVDDFDMFGTSVFPIETDTPLVIDADAVLTGAISLEQFEMIAGRHTKIFDATALVDHTKFYRRGLITGLSIDEAARVITDSKVDDEIAEEIRAAGTKLEVASMPSDTN